LDRRALALLTLLMLVTPVSLLATPTTGDDASWDGSPSGPPISANISTVSVDYPKRLDPFDYSDVLVLINNNSALSKQIGEYFAAARGIASERVAYLDVPAREIIYMSEMDDLKQQVKDYMIAHDLVDTTNYIVTTKGFPLKTRVPGTNMGHTAYYRQACVDEELALIFNTALEPYISQLWTVNNPYAGHRAYFDRGDYNIYLVNRLTGYDWDDVKHVIDSVNESYGNRGEFVLDVSPSRDASPGYKVGNDWLRNARDILEDRGEDVFFDDTDWYVVNREDVMGYASWGSNDGNATDHAKPHNTWQNGSIAETFVSTGGRSFRPGTGYGQSLIADWIAEGVTGIKGYVWEPFLTAIAHPDILFERYTAGFNLAESYRMASGHLSWMGVVVGDPKCSAYRDVPDIYLDVGRSMSLSNVTPATGDPLTVQVKVENRGGLFENASVNLYVDDVLWVKGNATFDKFSVTTINITLNAPLAEGEHEVMVRLNEAPNQVFETFYDDQEDMVAFTAKQRPLIDLTSSTDEALTLESVRFDITVTRRPRPITTFYFDFGDGTPLLVLQSNSFFHSYDQDGTYTVRAWVIDEDMVLSPVVSLEITINNRVPRALIAVDPTEAPTASPFTFNASGSTDDDGTVVSVSWDLGDGNTSTEWELTHSYERPGDYLVKLEVWDDDGDSASVTKRVTALNRDPTAAFSLQGEKIYKGRSVSFDASASGDPDGRIVQYEWEFGDGGSGEVTTSPLVLHTFERAGNVTVTLTVYDDLGGLAHHSEDFVVINLPPVAELDMDVDTVLTLTYVNMEAKRSYDPDGEVVGFEFAVMDPEGAYSVISMGAFDTATYRPTDDGDHTIILKVFDEEGAFSDTSLVLTVINRPPVADLDGATEALEGTVVTAPTTLTLMVESSDPDGLVESIVWRDADGDATVGNGGTVELVLGEERPYTIQVTVTDDDGDSVLLWLNFTSNLPPTADFNITVNGRDPSQVSIHPSTRLSFNAAGSADPGGISRYEWNFGDGFTAGGVAAEHFYTAEGTYRVTLKVTDDHGATDERTWDVTVVERPIEEPALSTGMLAALIAIIIVVVLVAVLATQYMRKRSQGEEGQGD
jgi:uncharacterized protein (TIGR03790 family)